jgi:putative ABC transport system permease protein
MQHLRISGIYDKSNNAFAGDYFISLASYQANFTDQLDSVVGVNMKPGVTPAAGKQALNAALVDYPQLKIDDQATLKKSNEDQINQLLNIIYVLLALAVFIALFGIVNTLALSVFERTREIGLLRAVGMARRQVRRMITYEAVIVAVIGAYLGVIIGSFFGWATTKALHDSGVTTFSYPFGTLVIFVVLAGVAGVVAGFFPARRAARIDVLRAITTE